MAIPPDAMAALVKADAWRRHKARPMPPATQADLDRIKAAFERNQRRDAKRAAVAARNAEGR